MSNLKPCPFCGGTTINTELQNGTGEHECEECGAALYPSVVSTWNTRPIEDHWRKTAVKLAHMIRGSGAVTSYCIACGCRECPPNCTVYMVLRESEGQ